jgi:hypothetical protein
MLSYAWNRIVVLPDGRAIFSRRSPPCSSTSSLYFVSDIFERLQLGPRKKVVVHGMT